MFTSSVPPFLPGCSNYSLILHPNGHLLTSRPYLSFPEASQFLWIPWSITTEFSKLQLRPCDSPAQTLGSLLSKKIRVKPVALVYSPTCLMTWPRLTSLPTSLPVLVILIHKL